MNKILTFCFLLFFISIKSFAQGRLNGGDFCEDKITSILTKLTLLSAPSSGIYFDYQENKEMEQINAQKNEFYKQLLASDKKKCEQIPHRTIRISNSANSRSSIAICIHPEVCKTSDRETIFIINEAIREYRN